LITIYAVAEPIETGFVALSVVGAEIVAEGFAIFTLDEGLFAAFALVADEVAALAVTGAVFVAGEGFVAAIFFTSGTLI
jgi:hypothetical protein